MRSAPSSADRKDASGFLISCATSAANASVASIRCRSAMLMSDSARASMPISSRREGRRGTVTSCARPSRTLTAARDRCRSGRTMVRPRNMESIMPMPSAMAKNMPTLNRSARTNRRISRSLDVVRTAKRPSLDREPALITCVRSGAKATADAASAGLGFITCCQASAVSTRGSANGCSTAAPTKKSNILSMPRAMTFGIGSLLGSRKTYVGGRPAKLSRIFAPFCA